MSCAEMLLFCSGGVVRLFPLINRTRQLFADPPLSAAARRVIRDLNSPFGEHADNFTALVAQELVRTVVDWLCLPFLLVIVLTGVRAFHFRYRYEQLPKYWQQRKCCVEEAIGAVIDLPFFAVAAIPLLSIYRGEPLFSSVRCITFDSQRQRCSASCAGTVRKARMRACCLTASCSSRRSRGVAWCAWCS